MIPNNDPRWNVHTGGETIAKWGASISQDLSRIASQEKAQSLQAFTRAIRGLAHLASEIQQEDAAEALQGVGNILYGSWGKEAGFPAIPREFRVPKEVRDKPPLQPEGTDLAIWAYEVEVGGKTQYYAIAFQGKSNKPLWNYRFQSEQSRNTTIKETIETRKSVLAEKAKRKDDKKQFKHSLEKGDILYSSWGYDQTNVDFYEVTAVGDKQIVIREISSRVVSHSTGSEKVMAEPGDFVGPPMKKNPQMGHGGRPYVKINSVQTAYEWEGNPLYRTETGYGH